MGYQSTRFWAPPTILLAGSLALSCTANQMHRSVSIEELPNYSLAFIELMIR